MYIEEINANEGVKKRLTGISTTQSVEELKKAIAADLKNPEGWSSMSLAYCDQELSDREFMFKILLRKYSRFFPQ